MKLISIILIFISCSTKEQQDSTVIDASKLTQLQKDEVMIVDIRTQREFDQGHIPGVIHIDFLQNDFIQRISQYDNKKPLVIYCASGGRSRRASKALDDAGFVEVYDYSGGFKDWKAKGFKIER